MKSSKCPLLEVKVMVLCKMYPNKMIPLDESSSCDSPCQSENHKDCELYKRATIITMPKEGEQHGTTTRSNDTGSDFCD